MGCLPIGFLAIVGNVKISDKRVLVVRVGFGVYIFFQVRNVTWILVALFNLNVLCHKTGFRKRINFSFKFLGIILGWKNNQKSKNKIENIQVKDFRLFCMLFKLTFVMHALLKNAVLKANKPFKELVARHVLPPFILCLRN